MSTGRDWVFPGSAEELKNEVRAVQEEMRRSGSAGTMDMAYVKAADGTVVSIPSGTIAGIIMNKYKNNTSTPPSQGPSVIDRRLPTPVGITLPYTPVSNKWVFPGTSEELANVAKKIKANLPPDTRLTMDMAYLEAADGKMVPIGSGTIARMITDKYGPRTSPPRFTRPGYIPGPYNRPGRITRDGRRIIPRFTRPGYIPTPRTDNRLDSSPKTSVIFNI